MDTTTAPQIDGNDFDAVADNLILDRVDSSLEEATSETMEADAEGQDDIEDAEVVEDEASDYTDDDDTEDNTDLDEEPEQLYSVKVYGEEKTVTLDELRRGYSGQQAIQQGMQHVASAKKEVEQVYAALQAETQRVQQLRQQFESGSFTAPPKPPSDEMFKDDPIGYMEAKIAYDKQSAEWQQQQHQLQALDQQQKQIQQQALQAHLHQEMQALQQTIPEFADPKQAAGLKEKLVRTGLAYGFDAAALDQITDAKTVRVLYDAMKYREIMGAKGEAERRVEKARPVVKPGAKKPAKSSKAKQRQQATARMKQTGSVDDVANFLLS